MTENPYQAPASESSAYALPNFHQYFFRPTRTLGNWLCGMLVLCGVLTAIVGGLDVAGYFVVPGYAINDYAWEGTALFISVGMLVSGFGSMIVYLVSVVLFLTWMYRSAGNAHALGAEGVDVTPGWSIAYWFIPIVNLFRPYQAVSEIYRASASTESVGWKSDAVPRIFPAWWFCWVVGNIFSKIESRAAMGGWDLAGAAFPIGVTSTVLGVGSAILAAMVVRAVSDAQQDRSESLNRLNADHHPMVI